MARRDFKPLKQGDWIGIIGGGQLGRMLCMAAARLGFKTVILEPGLDCPASQTANETITAAYDDIAALRALAEKAAVITYEFENIPASAISFLEENNFLAPNSRALEISQDRLIEKQFLNDIGAITAPYHDVTNASSIVAALKTLNTSAILKTRRFGYDGKGQVRLGAPLTLAAAEAALEDIAHAPAILEGFVDFQREISVIAARDRAGRIICFDPAENVHNAGILRTSTVPAQISERVTADAMATTGKLATALDYVGAMGVEFFVDADDRLIVNEFAPRVHNSGHWTELACDIDQFEQHIRAIAGLPLAEPKRHSDCVMENLIGDDVDRLPEIISSSNHRVHLYGKAEVKPGRKMGHFTRITGPAR